MKFHPARSSANRSLGPYSTVIIGLAGECQQITDQNQWTTIRTGDIVWAHFPCIFARVIETPWYTGECCATSCLSCSATLSNQFPRFHSNYTANVVFQGQDMHTFFIHHHEQARNVRKSFRRYRSLWLKKYMWVSRGIELYPQNWGQAAVVDAWAVHSIWWIRQDIDCHSCSLWFLSFFHRKRCVCKRRMDRVTIFLALLQLVASWNAFMQTIEYVEAVEDLSDGFIKAGPPWGYFSHF